MTGEKKASAIKFHRRALMTAADRLLSERGYDGMNMNMLAAEAEYSKATVYVYFSSKDEIVTAITVERLELLRKEISLAVKSDITADEKLAEAERIIREFAEEDAVYFDFIFQRAKGECAETLYSIVNGILYDLSEVCEREQLLEKWYALYGRLKTEKIFIDADNS